VSIQVKALRGRREVLQRLDRYNRAALYVGAEQLPALVCFADEIRALAALGPEAEQALGTITSEGRKFGVYFVGASQSWKTSVIDSDVRSQFWSRICLPGATVRQTAELFEIEQSEARQVVAQLTAPGIAALWRRGAGTTILRTPFVDLESDRAYTMIEAIATNRKLNAPKERLSNPPESAETFQQRETLSRPLESGISTFPDISSDQKNATIDVEKREKVAEMLEGGNGKMAIIKEVWGVGSGRAYQAAAGEYDAIVTSLTAN
jgi:Holliday junction resolvase